MSLLKSLRVRASQGSQYVADLRSAVPRGFRGLPVISDASCASECRACAEVCPTRAIALSPVTLDLGRCVFCNECVQVCPQEKIAFSANPRMGGGTREQLLVRQEAEEVMKVRASATFSKLFGRSLKLRQVSAGGCNACELELNALANVNFDLQRFGIEWVASPRHADALVLSGPITVAMANAVQLAWDAMPEPRFLAVVGACAISGGLYEHAQSVERGFLGHVGPALYVPGCPPHPLTFANAILDLLGVA